MSFNLNWSSGKWSIGFVESLLEIEIMFSSSGYNMYIDMSPRPALVFLFNW